MLAIQAVPNKSPSWLIAKLGRIIELPGAILQRLADDCRVGNYV
jgi:hypothetical protein